jgi:hypothetical protein
VPETLTAAFETQELRGVPVGVGVPVTVAVGLGVAVPELVPVGVTVGVRLGVEVVVFVGLAVAVPETVPVGLGVDVVVFVGLEVAVPETVQVAVACGTGAGREGRGLRSQPPKPAIALAKPTPNKLKNIFMNLPPDNDLYRVTHQNPQGPKNFIRLSMASLAWMIRLPNLTTKEIRRKASPLPRIRLFSEPSFPACGSLNIAIGGAFLFHPG